MALSPEAIKRRKRIILPRAPHKGLGEGPREADEELKELLKELVALADRETLFTMTLERPRLMSALNYAGFVFTFYYNYEGQIGPGVTVTTYLPVLPGWVFVPIVSSYYSSLPWWLTVNIWIDSDLPALPTVSLTRTPDRYDYTFRALSSMRRFMRFTVTNNHAVNTANYLAIQQFWVMRISVWEMLEAIYLNPIAVYAQEKAEELTGRPWP